MKEGSIVDSSKNMIEGQFAEATDIPEKSSEYPVRVVMAIGNLATFSTVTIAEGEAPLVVIPVGRYGSFYRITISNQTSHKLKCSYFYNNSYMLDTSINAGDTATLSISNSDPNGMTTPDLFYGSPVVVEIEE